MTIIRPLPKVARVRLLHASALWSISGQTLAAELHKHLDDVDLIALTEQTNRRRAAQLHATGWVILHDPNPPLWEMALMVRDAAWEVVEWRAHIIGPDLGPGAEVVAIVAVLVHRKTKARLIVTAAHLPASVEGDWAGMRARAYRDAAREWKRVVRDYRRRYRRAPVVWSADWNINLHRLWVRVWLRARWPAATLPKRIDGGTHRGGRFIDFAIAHGIKRWRITGIIPTRGVSDHAWPRHVGVAVDPGPKRRPVPVIGGRR